MQKTLIVGIGSPHGDDRAGWTVIDRLQSVGFSYASLCKASVPHDLLDWMEGLDSLHIIDSYYRDALTSTLFRFELQASACIDIVRCRRPMSNDKLSSQVLTTGQPIRFRSTGSHQIDVFTVLELAASLDRLPPDVVLWAVPGQRFIPGEAISSICEAAIQDCLSAITMEFRHA